MSPKRPMPSKGPKPTKAFDRKSLTPSKKPTSGPNVVNKLTAGPSSKMDQKAMVDKMTRKGSGVSPKLPLGGLGKAVVDKMTRKGSGVSPKPPQRQSAAPTAMMKKGGMCKTKKYARGGGIEVRGKTKGKMI